MKIPKIYFVGFNGFDQFISTDNIIKNFTEYNYKEILDDGVIDIETFQICCSWNYNALAVNNKLYIVGSNNKQDSEENVSRYVHSFQENIKQIAINQKYSLILLKNGKLYKLTIFNNTVNKLEFLTASHDVIESTQYPLNDDTEQINQIICGETFALALTNYNNLYSIPSKIYTFEKHIKIIKMCSGFEHVLFLTSNGDVYVWGNSSRSQLGLGSVETEDIPILLEGLAGVKIIDISCGGWHSAAVSAFGDLYMWGWNINGQLGKPITKEITINKNNGVIEKITKKLPSVYNYPEIIEIVKEHEENNELFEYNISKVFCGVRHTIIQTNCNKILGCGWNKYGQLGSTVSGDKTDCVQEFKLIDIGIDLKENLNLYCGNWCTLIMEA